MSLNQRSFCGRELRQDYALQVSRAFRAQLADERVWHMLCTVEWGASTDVRRWVVKPTSQQSQAPLAIFPLLPPQTFRCVGGWGRKSPGPKSGKTMQAFLITLHLGDE